MRRQPDPEDTPHGFHPRLVAPQAILLLGCPTRHPAPNVGIMEHKSKLRKGLLQNHEGGQWEKKGKAGRAAEA